MWLLLHIIGYYYITWLLRCHYIIITLLLRSLLLHHYYVLLHYYHSNHYYILLQLYYYVLLHYYYVIITSLLCHYYFIITKRKSCNNDCIITCYAHGVPPLLRHYYTLFRHYYTDLCYYPLLLISVSRTCRWPSQNSCLMTHLLILVYKANQSLLCEGGENWWCLEMGSTTLLSQTQKAPYQLWSKMYTSKFKHPRDHFQEAQRHLWQGACVKLLLPLSSEHLTLFRSIRGFRKLLLAARAQLGREGTIALTH